MWLDPKLTMSTHINNMCGEAFFYLYNIRHISTQTLIHVFITSILDYCNSLFYSLLNSVILKLQRIQKACAYLVCSVPKFCHVTPILRYLHWLPVRQLIDFQIILITFKILNDNGSFLSFFSYLCYGLGFHALFDVYLSELDS